MAKGDPCKWCGVPVARGKQCYACAQAILVEQCRVCEGPYWQSLRGCRLCLAVKGPITHSCRSCLGNNFTIKSWSTSNLCNACEKRASRNAWCDNGHAMNDHGGEHHCPTCGQPGDTEVTLLSPCGIERIVWVPRRLKITGAGKKTISDFECRVFRVPIAHWLRGVPSVRALKNEKCMTCRAKMRVVKKGPHKCPTCHAAHKAAKRSQWRAKHKVPRGRTCVSCLRSDSDTAFYNSDNTCWICERRAITNGRCVVCQSAIYTDGTCKRCDMEALTIGTAVAKATA